jgi:hypothetical protein
MDKRQRGIYPKFVVKRADRKDSYGKKHFGCEYFVLDLSHDPYAEAAIRVYADECQKDGYIRLAQDLRARADAMFRAKRDGAERF